MRKKTTLIPWPNPNWKENPYQKLLYRALKKHGIKIRRTPPYFFWLPHLPPADWLHLNWPSRLYGAASPQLREEQFHRFVNTLLKVKNRGTKLLWTMHNLLPHDTVDPDFHAFAQGKIAELSDLIHLHDERAADTVQHRYQIEPDKIHVMAHGHYGDYYGKPMPRIQARRRLGIPEHSVVLLNFGNLRRYKGLEKAIAAFKAGSNQNLLFLVAGHPDDQDVADFLKNESVENPQLLLKLSKFKEKEIMPLFAASDAFIFPSENFFTSGSVMLALTYELPIIATPNYHLRAFAGKTFFQSLQTGSASYLTHLMDHLENWLERVNYDELRATKQELQWEKLTPGLSEALKAKA